MESTTGVENSGRIENENEQYENDQNEQEQEESHNHDDNEPEIEKENIFTLLVKRMRQSDAEMSVDHDDVPQGDEILNSLEDSSSAQYYNYNSNDGDDEYVDIENDYNSFEPRKQSKNKHIDIPFVTSEMKARRRSEKSKSIMSSLIKVNKKKRSGDTADTENSSSSLSEKDPIRATMEHIITSLERAEKRQLKLTEKAALIAAKPPKPLPLAPPNKLTGLLLFLRYIQRRLYNDVATHDRLSQYFSGYGKIKDQFRAKVGELKKLFKWPPHVYEGFEKMTYTDEDLDILDSAGITVTLKIITIDGNQLNVFLKDAPKREREIIRQEKIALAIEALQKQQRQQAQALEMNTTSSSSSSSSSTEIPQSSTTNTTTNTTTNNSNKNKPPELLLERPSNDEGLVLFLKFINEKIFHEKQREQFAEYFDTNTGAFEMKYSDLKVSCCCIYR